MYRHRITLQELTSVSDGYGGLEEIWVDTKTIWGKVEPLSGKELIQAQQTQTQYTHRVRTRFNNNVNDNMQIKHNNKVFEIQSVINVDERNKELEIMCIEMS